MTNNMWKNLDFIMTKTSYETMAYLIGTTEPYREQVEKAILAEECYEKLELTETQKGVIDFLLEQRETAAQGYSNLAYLAGVIDCMTMMRKCEWKESDK